MSVDYSSDVRKSRGDFLSGDIVIQCCRQCIVKFQAISGLYVGCRPEVGSRLSYLQRLVSGLGARPDVDVQVTSLGGSSIPDGLSKAEVVLGNYFRFWSITQNLVLHDVHNMETAVTTGNALVLLYHF